MWCLLEGTSSNGNGWFVCVVLSMPMIMCVYIYVCIVIVFVRKTRGAHLFWNSTPLGFFNLFLKWTIFSLYWIGYNIASVLCFVGFFAGEACEILTPRLGVKPDPPTLDGIILAMGLPGKSLHSFVFKPFSIYCAAACYFAIWNPVCVNKTALSFTFPSSPFNFLLFSSLLPNSLPVICLA